MLKILCVDDDVIQHKNLKHLFEESKMKVDVSYYIDSDALFFDFEDHTDIDAIFLDIEMTKMNGLEIAKKLRAMDYDLPIVFITGYTQYAIDGYEVQAFDYILKPINLDKLITLLHKLTAAKKNDYRRTHLFDTEQGQERVYEDEIEGLEALGNTVRIDLKDRTLIVKASLNSIMKKLNPKDFIQCHRSYVINLASITTLHKDTITLANGKVFPISRRLRNEVFNLINEYFLGEGYQL